MDWRELCGFACMAAVAFIIFLVSPIVDPIVDLCKGRPVDWNSWNA